MWLLVIEIVYTTSLLVAEGLKTEDINEISEKFQSCTEL